MRLDEILSESDEFDFDPFNLPEHIISELVDEYHMIRDHNESMPDMVIATQVASNADLPGIDNEDMIQQLAHIILDAVRQH